MKALPFLLIGLLITVCVMVPRSIKRFKENVLEQKKTEEIKTTEKTTGTATKQSGTSAISPQQVGSENKWEVVQETYKGGNGKSWLKTDRSLYEVGTMSGHGFVNGIKGLVVYCTTPGLKPLYVCAVDRVGITGESAEPPTQTEQAQAEPSNITDAQGLQASPAMDSYASGLMREYHEERLAQTDMAKKDVNPSDPALKTVKVRNGRVAMLPPAQPAKHSSATAK